MVMIGNRCRGPARKKARMRTVATAGAPIIQKALTPDFSASSVETRMEVAPNQAAVRERKTSPPDRLLEARKKSSRFFILREKTRPTKITRTKYAAKKNRNTGFIEGHYSKKGRDVCYNRCGMKKSGFFCLLLAVSVALIPAQQTPQATIARLEKMLQTLNSFQADFEQAQYSTSISTPLKQKGKLFFKKPDWMRWEYEAPEPSIYVYKEGLYLSYFPDDNQLWRQRILLEQYESEIPALLAGKARLAEKYVIEASSFPGGDKNSIQLKLTPKEEGENAYLLLEIDQKSGMIRRVILFDWANNKIEYGFSRVKTNPRLADGLFEIKVPPDCEIIEDASPRKK
jgi:outer membrane lipoprotein carrier protein